MSQPNKNEFNASPEKSLRHVAIIMDGNGRWAKERGLERTAGHVKGVDTVRVITEAAREANIEYLTLYAFSTENWNRPKAEVDALMALIVSAIERETPDLIKNNVRLTTIGDRASLPAESRNRLEECMEKTSKCDGMTLVLALSYSSRWEIVEACRKLVAQAGKGELREAEVDSELFSRNLSTAGMPDPDLLIRTGGDRRVSNFLLWQIAYAELYFTEKFWPDFNKDDFREAIKTYQSRERRFGLTSEQIKSQSKNNYAQ